MTHDEAFPDRKRAHRASVEIVDGRDPVGDYPQILVTLDHVIATVLIATCNGDPVKAAAMLNEGTVPSVEERLLNCASRQRSK